jgi:hypothetical protein
MEGRRVIRQQNIFKDMQLDFAQRSLIVNYSIESVMADGAGDVVGTEVSAQRKRVRLKVLTEDTDIPALAEAILVGCDLIPRGKLRLVIELLYELQQEDLNAMRGAPAGGAGTGYDRGAEGKRDGVDDAAAADEDDEDDDMRGASMNDVDDYLERLYEDDVAQKVAGARRILALAVQPVNLRALVERSSLMGALARILREDWKKNAELILVLLQVREHKDLVRTSNSTLVFSSALATTWGNSFPRCLCCRSSFASVTSHSSTHFSSRTAWGTRV